MEHRSDSSHSGLDNAYIGCRVREARAEYGMTQEEDRKRPQAWI